MRSALLLLLAAGLAAGESAAALSVEEHGKRWVLPVRDPGAWANPWPAGWEAGLRERTDLAIRQFQGKARAFTEGEGEKWSYPDNIGAYWAGDREPAIAGLIAPDNQAGRDHEWTGGFDFYWCFNLKGQVPKWFLFRNDFPEAYRTAYAAGAKTWTASDPRPTMEYALLLESSDAEVRAFALGELGKMWRDTAQLLAMADEAAKSGENNKKVFADFIRANAAAIGAAKPTTTAEWQAWWGRITAGDWMVFEEYEREVNPNPHPKYGIGTGPVGAAWDPGVRGTRADARNTDNLRGMREVAIYLFAEDTGNDLMRRVYKEKLRRTALGFWEVGNGEWDSEGYLAHAMAPYHSLYAFAKDEAVRGYAKAILDFLYTSAALKYWRGSWGGPIKRDYGNLTPYSTAAHMVWLWFGDAPKAPDKREMELAFAFHSGYRPPAAVVALAQKRFDRPLDMLSSRPAYANWLPGQSDAPEFRETLGWGETWQMGSLARGGGGDVNGAKILAWSSDQGAAHIVPGMGKAKYITTFGTGADSVGQHRNLLVWASTAQGGKAPMQVLLPLGAQVSVDGSTAFVRLERTWLAATAVNGAWDAKVGEQGLGKGGKEGKAVVLKGAGAGGALAGFVIELGEERSHGGWDAFVAAVKAKASVAVDGTTVKAVAASGARIDLTCAAGDGLPVLVKDGLPHDWAAHLGIWQPVPGGKAPVTLRWKERVLTVEAGGHRFTGTLSTDGAYESSPTLRGD